MNLNDQKFGDENPIRIDGDTATGDGRWPDGLLRRYGHPVTGVWEEGASINDTNPETRSYLIPNKVFIWMEELNSGVSRLQNEGGSCAE